MRFFDYSPAAPEFYKSTLTATVNKYDKSSDGSYYTPRVAAVLVSLLSSVQILLSNVDKDRAITYTNAFNGMNMAIIPLTSVIVTFCNSVMQNTERKFKQLVHDGIRNGYFNTPPGDKILDIENDVPENDARDAKLERMLRTQ